MRGAAISPELQRRSAAYVGTVVAGLSNIVAREEFVLTGPDRRVTSDFLLVRYPGSIQDLLTFRDVAAVNGTALPDRQADVVAHEVGQEDVHQVGIDRQPRRRHRL